MPSDRLVRITYGQESFKPRAGLYGVGDVDTQWNLIEGFRLILFASAKSRLVQGGLFSIHGFQFMLYLEEAGLPEKNDNPDLHRSGEQHIKTFYPLQGLNFQIGKAISQTHVRVFVIGMGAIFAWQSDLLSRTFRSRRPDSKPTIRISSTKRLDPANLDTERGRCRPCFEIFLLPLSRLVCASFFLAAVRLVVVLCASTDLVQSTHAVDTDIISQ